MKLTIIKWPLLLFVFNTQIFAGEWTKGENSLDYMLFSILNHAKVEGEVNYSGVGKRNLSQMGETIYCQSKQFFQLSQGLHNRYKCIFTFQRNINNWKYISEELFKIFTNFHADEKDQFNFKNLKKEIHENKIEYSLKGLQSEIKDSKPLVLSCTKSPKGKTSCQLSVQ